MAWSPLVELVTLEQAKQRVKLPDYGSPITAEDEALQLQLLIAHELVMDFLAQRVSDQDTWQATVDAWDADTAPKRVLGAILEQFAFQYRFRGDDVESNDRDRHSVLCPNAEALLMRFRDPAIG